MSSAFTGEMASQDPSHSPQIEAKQASPEPESFTVGSAYGNEPVARATTTTVLCHECGHSLKTKLRVRSVENPAIFRSGYLPSPYEQSFISTLIDEAEEDLGRYNKELVRLRTVAAMVSNKQKTLEAYIGDLRCAVSPIRRLPPEILSDIFKYVCCNYVGVNCISKEKMSLPTVALSHVCTRWRRIVESTPSLWTSITLKHATKYVSSYWLETFLSTSRSSPLDLVVGYKHTALEDIALLMQHSNRWRNVSFSISHRRIGREVFGRIKEDQDFPELVSLKVELDNNSVVALDNARESVLPVGCNKLRNLSLHAFNVNLLYPRPSIELLHLFALTSGRICHLIENSPNLKTLVLRFCHASAPSHFAQLYRLTSNLHTLKVDFDRGSGPAEDVILQTLILPRLIHLQLLDSRKTSSYDVAPIIVMLQRSSCSLTHLTIHIWLQEDKLLDMLHCTSTITHLEIRESGMKPMVTDDVLRKLTISKASHSANLLASSSYHGATGPDMVNSATVNDAAIDNATGSVPSAVTSQILLPRLVALELDVQPAFKDDVLIEMILSRWNPPATSSDVQASSSYYDVARLRNFNLKRATGALFDQLRKRLEDIGREGLGVSF